MNKQHFSGESILSQMPSVLKWLESFGLKALSSRYSRYIKYINEFYKVEIPDSKDGRSKFTKLTKSYQECLYITYIYKVFHSEISEGFKEKLYKVITGADHLTDNISCEARNYLFELLIAAKFFQCGYEIDFDVLTDVVAMKNGHTVYAECKKISSKKGFEQNFKKAGKQLQAKIEENNKNISGLIFIDISNCLLDNLPQSEIETSELALKYLKDAMIYFVEQQNGHIETLNNRFSSYSLGVYLMGQYPAWTKDHVLYSVENSEVITAETISDMDFEKLKKMLNGFEEAFHVLEF